jgi:hypothetical protein
MSDEAKEKSGKERQISIQSDSDSVAGVYANLMMVTHRKEEFVLDFVFVHPQPAPGGPAVGTLRSRVITSPEHVKRIVRALEENVRRYEGKFGQIEEATDLPKIVH